MGEVQIYITKHEKTDKITNNRGGCRLATGGVFTSPLGGGCKNITALDYV